MNQLDEEELLPLTENLSNSLVDTSKLINYVSEIYPIGMENFRMKKQARVDSGINLARQRWKLAVQKLKKLKDPWEKFHIDNYETEIVIRHRYNAVKKEWVKDGCRVKIEKKQFANGAMRACFRVKKLSNFAHKESWESAANYVAKCYKDCEIHRERYFDDVRLQMDAKLWAEIFNRHNPPKKIDMFQVSILEFINRPGCPLFHLEHFIEGDYIKYNSNSGFVEDCRCTPQAFSHFTFECSHHNLMVVDIQGVGDLYTDPQIHTAIGNDYGDGNLGCKGFALFFSSHICNKVCKSLGLTEFNLSPIEIEKLNGKNFSKNSNQFSRTVCRGQEELVLGSPTNLGDFLRKRNRQISNNDMESEGYESSSSLTQIKRSSIRERFQSESSFINYEFSDHFKPRSSCANTEKNILNKFLQIVANDERNDGNFISHDESILGKIHFEMAKYHEIGRFSEKEFDNCDLNSAFFHLKHAGDLGVREAIINLAKIYLQLPHDLLSSFILDENDENLEIGFKYLIQSADFEDKNSLFILAKAYDTGINLPKSRKIDWNLASCYYKKLLQLMEDEHLDEDSGYIDNLEKYEPSYAILARLAELNLKGGFNLVKNFNKALILYNEAAEKAKNYGEGRIANKYYMLSEKLACLDD
ncbi:unnamed protein product [Brachionus calyciflorus]|uniref:Alpha-type protein kinase domain-containing protein n=1 Tax=Brachionus calyciflorus TaxID=104777 RepID=A0A813UR41_9BILA|nr:unnamed protein product [Brachionus calyciflorus]